MIGTMMMTMFLGGIGSVARADDQAATVVDKAIQALGGAEKLSGLKAATWKSKGKINFGGSENDLTAENTIEGLDHYRLAWAGDFNGNKMEGATVVAGSKGWRKMGGTNEFSADELANEKRNIYLTVIPMTLVPLKDKSFKLKALKDEKVGDKLAAVIQVTGPEGKEFTLYFDKETYLPVKLAAQVVGFDGADHKQETYYTDYKEVDGIKKAMKVDNKQDGEKFLNLEITEFKVLDKADPKQFEEPK
jgi:hypothetical protein